MPTSQIGKKPLPVIDYLAIGRRVREIRRRQHMTQAKLGRAIDKSTSFLGHIERGTRVASLETIVHIASVLGTSVDALLTGMPRLTPEQSNSTHNMRLLNDVMYVLHKYADEWMRDI